MILLDSQFQTVKYIKEKSLIYMIPKPTTANMSFEEMQTELLLYLEQVIKYQPNKVIFDLREYYFFADEKSQVWMDEHVASKEREICLIQAYVVRKEDLSEQSNIQEIVQMEHNRKMHTRFFSSLEDAETWLTLLDS